MKWAEFKATTLTRIQAVLANYGDDWTLDGDLWKCSDRTICFSPEAIYLWLKPEAIVSVLRARERGRTFIREGVGWGFRKNHRWRVETWEGEHKMFNRKADAKAWLDER